jgi:ketopantoate hydroxymethyltransferase
VIVTVIAVRMVQMAADAIIDMVAMGHCLVTAARAMHMTGFVTAAAMISGTNIRVRGRHFDHMLIDMPFMRMVQMAVMQIVDMTLVAHGLMPAAGPMLMRMFRMLCAGASVSHWFSSFPCRDPPAPW